MRKNKVRVVLLISGNGTTAETIIKSSQNGRLKNIDVVGLISSRKNALGLRKAQNLGVDTYTVDRKVFSDSRDFGNALVKLLKELGPDLISQNGWLPLTPSSIVDAYKGKIINQHPGSLDPTREYDFGGKGMYGARVICAALAYSCITNKNLWIEATTHFISDQYDKGNLIKTSRLYISKYVEKVTLQNLYNNANEFKSKVIKLQEELLPIEHRNVIDTLALFETGQNLEGYKRTDALIEQGNYKTVEDVKKLAVTLFPDG